MFLYGKNSVSQRLKSDPASIKRVFLTHEFSDPAIEALLKSRRVSVRRVSVRELRRIKSADSLQGIVASVDKFKYADFTALLNRPQADRPCFIFLDRVFDPQNLGAIIRIAACFGGFALVIPRHKACGVTETALHIASGGENFTPVAMVSNLTNALLTAKKSGWWVMGAVVDGGEDIDKISLPFPLCFVLGSEGFGIRYGVGKHLDIKAHIPMSGAPLSLNVAVSCAIFCHKISSSHC